MFGLSDDLLWGAAIGWLFGGLGTWQYLSWARLIRTAPEWYADRERRGLRVPPNWRDEE